MIHEVENTAVTNNGEEVIRGKNSAISNNRSYENKRYQHINQNRKNDSTTLATEKQQGNCSSEGPNSNTYMALKAPSLKT
jgi:hypothetical protein